MSTPLIIIIAAFFIVTVLRYMEPDGDVDTAIQAGIGGAFYAAILVGGWYWLTN